MSIGIGDNLGKSFEFAKNRLVGKWVDWIILIVLTLIIMVGGAIPIVGWVISLLAGVLLTGFIIRVYRGGEPKLDNYVKMFIDGILATIIGIIYMIVPIILAVIFGAAAFMTSMTSFNPANAMDTISGLTAGIGIVGIIVTFIVAIIFGILATMAIVRFAKEEKFGAAFEFGEIFKIVGKIGWLHYILSWIVLMIIFAVIFFIFILLSLIIIGLILMLVFMPFMMIWQAKYFAQLYESA
ncbi:DUF4013 domain-containing protein [Methanorbis rubei]|uniref:DUF4013 domain-containing protein n=1 Tax=Methanorbis rubei TaxID=3028300 RepID=A0AAE4MDR3_9EURY|nr:hypothetical protein [Methanocorpusculaceae archaeon Cs1]